MSYLRSFLPNRISGQIALIIAASLIAIHAVLTTVFFLTRPDHRPPPSDELAAFVALIGASPAASRAGVAAAIAAAFPSLELTFADRPAAADPAPAGAASADPRLNGLRRHLGPDYRIAAAEDRSSSPDQPRLAIQLPDGDVITARPPSMPPPSHWGGPFALALLTLATSVTLLGLWAARGLTGPLRHFAKAAENFSPETDIAALPERGPLEIRAAARALNQMRERIKNLVDGRTRMLAAVSHDLRTPITRMRLRCEFIEDQTTRTQMLGELAHMNTMVESVLTFLRDGQSREQMSAVDLATSLQTICDHFVDCGHDVHFCGPDHVVVRAQAEGLHRAITNLVDNAVRYADKVDVRLTAEAREVVVSIEDDGPGIAAQDKDAMIEPFVRGDAARTMNHNGGFGLGLSIARTVIEAHGGTLTLLDRTPSGLIARVALPQPASP